MLFYIAPSVAKSLLNGDAETFDFVCRLIDSRRRGLLLIHAAQSTYEFICDYMANSGRKIEAEILKSVARRRHETHGLLKDLTKFVFVSTYVKRVRMGSKKIIFISPKIINYSNFLYYPVVLAENLDDCDLYFDAIAKNYDKDIPSSLKKIRMEARKQLGGGNTTHTQYDYHKRQSLDFCICVVDSDRRCPEEREGDTAKFVMDSDRKNPSSHCDHIVIDVYSAENLISESQIRLHYSKGKNPQQIAEVSKLLSIRKNDSWKYLPLKKGIRGVELKTEKAYSKYWREELNKNGIVIPCCDMVDCECIVIPALSSKTLANSIAVENCEWYKSLNDEINPHLKKIYKGISQEFRSWLCVGREMRS